MAKFTKKPIEIEAFKCSDILYNATNNWEELPKCILDGYEEGKILFGFSSIYIKTLEGEMTANIDDWIIQGIQGELYPCKPGIFQETYDLVYGEVNEIF